MAARVQERAPGWELMDAISHIRDADDLAERAQAAMKDDRIRNAEREDQGEVAKRGFVIGTLLAQSIHPLAGPIAGLFAMVLALKLRGSSIPWGPTEVELVDFMHAHRDLTREEALKRALMDHALRCLLKNPNVKRLDDGPNGEYRVAPRVKHPAGSICTLSPISEQEILAYLQANPAVPQEHAIREIAKEHYLAISKNLSTA